MSSLRPRAKIDYKKMSEGDWNNGDCLKLDEDINCVYGGTVSETNDDKGTSWSRENIDRNKENEISLQEKILGGCEDGLQVEDIPNKGRGVLASKPFLRGDFVVQYVGDLIDMDEAKKRDEKYAKDSTKGCYMYYFIFKNKKYCIDATEESGKLGRLLNHSKTNGNCHTKLVSVHDRPYLILAASRDIAAGQELQYDYGDRSKASIDSHPWLKS